MPRRPVDRHATKAILEAVRSAMRRPTSDAETALEALREACRPAFAREPSEEQLAELLLQHLAMRPMVANEEDDGIAPTLDRVVTALDLESVASESDLATFVPDGPSLALDPGLAELRARFLDALLREHLGLALADATVLDPIAGRGEALAGLPVGRVLAAESSLPDYYRAARRLRHGTLAFADLLCASERGATLSFDFFESENARRVRTIRESEVDAIVAAPSAKLAERLLPWSIARLRNSDGAPRIGLVALFTEEPIAGLDHGLDTLELDLRADWGLVLTLCVRREGSVRVARLDASEPLPEGPADVPWRSRAEARPDWTSALPLGAEDASGLFRLQSEGVSTGRDAWVWDDDRDALFAKVERTAAFYHEESARLAGYAGRNAVRRDEAAIHWTPALEAQLRRRRKIALKPENAVRGLRRPFSRSWLYLDPVLVDRPGRWLRLRPDPCLLVSRGSGDVLVADVVPDRRALGAEVSCYPLAEGVAPGAMARFRAVYGTGIGERSVFDYVVALLHHPDYKERYAEELRRDEPRIPLLPTESLAVLLDFGAPPVGEGTAFGTGWLDAESFEPGTVPDYDDPFASPYARADVDPGFLLFAGLGSALSTVQTRFDRMTPFALDRSETSRRDAKPRLSLTRGNVRLDDGTEWTGIPARAFDYRVGGKSPVEWTFERLRSASAPADAATEALGQAVAVSLETLRLVEIVRQVAL